jgi:DNA-directed RNA polymerase subunit omega
MLPFTQGAGATQVSTPNVLAALNSSPSLNAPEGITNPPIDDLLEQVSSKYALVIYAAKRARQINDYYAQLGEGLLEYVGPLVEPGPREKPLSIALREIHAGVLEHTEGE